MSKKFCNILLLIGLNLYYNKCLLAFKVETIVSRRLKTPFCQYFDPTFIPVFVHFFIEGLGCWSVASRESEPWSGTSNKSNELSLKYLLGMASVLFPLKLQEFIFSCLSGIRSCVVLLQKSSCPVNQCRVFLPHNGVHRFQPLGVRIDIDVNYYLMVQVDAWHHQVSETQIFFHIFYSH